jgi:hypothetical protein
MRNANTRKKPFPSASIQEIKMNGRSKQTKTDIFPFQLKAIVGLFKPFHQ